MSQIDAITLERHAGTSSVPPTHLNRYGGPLAVILLLLVALAVVPLASNRPFFWAFWPMLLGLIAVGYGLVLQVGRGQLRVPFNAVRVQFGLFAAICLVLVIQLLPLGALYWGAGLKTQGGQLLAVPFVTTTPGETLLMLLRWCGYGLLFFLALQFARNGERRLLALNAVVVIVSLHAAIGILSFYQWGNTILGVEKWTYLDSITGTFVNRNSFATFLALGLTAATALIAHTMLYETTAVRRLTAISSYLVCLILMTGALLGSNSRVGLVVSVLGPMTVLFVYWANRGSAVSRGRLLTALLLVVVLAIAAVSIFDTGVWTRFLSLERSSAERLNVYAQVWEAIQYAPWLGYGGGSFELAFQVFHSPPVSVEYVWSRAHNTYLALWFELGLIGGTLPMLLVGSVTVATLRKLQGPDTLDPANALWIGAVVVAGVHSLFDFSLEMFAVALLFTLLAGMTLASGPTRKVSR